MQSIDPDPKTGFWIVLSSFAGVCTAVVDIAWTLGVAAPGIRGWHMLEGVQFRTRPLLALRGEDQSPAHRKAMHGSVIRV